MPRVRPILDNHTAFLACTSPSSRAHRLPRVHTAFLACTPPTPFDTAYPIRHRRLELVNWSSSGQPTPSGQLSESHPHADVNISMLPETASNHKAITACGLFRLKQRSTFACFCGLLSHCLTQHPQSRIYILSGRRFVPLSIGHLYCTT